MKKISKEAEEIAEQVLKELDKNPNAAIPVDPDVAEALGYDPSHVNPILDDEETIEDE